MTKGSQTDPMVGEDSSRLTLEDVIADLGPHLVKAIVAPRGFEVEVEDLVIYDPIARPHLDPGSLVLAVGVRFDKPEAAELVRYCDGASAILLKLHGGECGVAALAQEMGVALLTVPDEMSWSHLHALLGISTSVGTRSAGTGGMASVPIGDLFALANAIAAMVGGAVTIEDPRARVLAYSNLEGQTIDPARQQSILGRQVPDTPEVRALYKRLRESTGVIQVEAVEEFGVRARLAVPVRVGLEQLGSIWALVGDKPMAEDAEQVLAEAGRLAALHMIQARAYRDVERRIEGDFLRSFLAGRGTVESAATRLGIQADSALAMLAFQLPLVERAQEELHRERLVDLVAVYCEAFHHRVPCVAEGRVVYALLPVKKPQSGDWLKSFAMGLLGHAESTLGTEIRVAVGSIVADLAQVPRARQEVDWILRVLNTFEASPKVAAIEDVNNQAILMRLRDLTLEHEELLRGPLQVMLQHDAAKGTSFVETLRGFLDAYGDASLAAARLKVHPNTFRYRLRRLQEIFDLDLEDTDERLVLELQLRLMMTEGR